MTIATLLQTLSAKNQSEREFTIYLFGNWLANVLLVCGALTVRDFLGVDLGDKRADTSCLLLAVP